MLLSPVVQAQIWQAVGPTGGDVRALASDPSHPEVLYLGTTDGFIFGSHDSGGHWESLGLAGTNPNALVTSILVDPRNSAVIYSATWTREPGREGGGVFVSTDGARTWRDAGLAGHAVRALVQSPSNPDVLIAGALDGVFISRDSAATWERITPPDNSELRNFDSLAIDPQNPEIIYAGTFHLPWKTVDGGRHWFPIHDGMIDDSDVLSLTVDAANPQRIFASACSGIYRSDAAGGAWEKIEGIPYSSRRTPVIRQDGSDPSNLYAGTTEGLWKSTDGGATWRRVSPRNWVINSMVILPQVRGAQSRFLLGTEQQGLLLSDDGGLSFRASNSGFRHRRILSLAADPHDPSHLAAVLANSPAAVIVTEDGGQLWSPMGTGLDTGSDHGNVRQIYSSPTGWWASLSSGGFVRWDQRTNTWSHVGVISESAPPNVVDVAEFAVGFARPRSEAHAFRAVVNDMSFGDFAWFAATDLGLFVSRDAGKFWTSLPFAPGRLPVDSVRVSRDGKTIRLVSSRGMVFSDDAGDTWTWHDLPLESGGALRLEWADNNAWLAVARAGLYISRDAGTTWSKAQSGLPGALADGLLIHPEFWLVSMQSSGLFISRDEGATWTRLKDPDSPMAEKISDGPFSVLASVGDAGQIYAASVNEGLYLLQVDTKLSSESLPTGTSVGK
jgi:photosystem II stability/assembly factor-like uncharacterized protein